jgi:transcriptional regulator with XRE-family HTH domain
MLESRIAQRLAALRTERQWSLEALAKRTGISRATLSRVERNELSPTASMLGKLCAAYEWTLSRLMADAEASPANLIRAGAQTQWKDPETGYCRRLLSPPGPGLRGELVEISLPAGAEVTYDDPPVPGLEHHLWMLGGAVHLTIEGTLFRLRPGDCLRYVLRGSSKFECKSRSAARYLIAMVHP